MAYTNSKHHGRDTNTTLSAKKKTQVLDNPDANNITAGGNSVVTQDDDLLNSEEKRRAFIQIAALNQMDINSTYDFLRLFFFGEDFSKAVCVKLMQKYADDILSSTNMMQGYFENKFETLSIMHDAKIINEGITFVKKSQDKVRDFMKDATNIEDVTKLITSGKSISSQYDDWAKRRDDLKIKLEAMAIDLSQRASNTETEGNYLSGKKVSNVLKKYGVDDVLAERLGAVIAHGDESLE
jgi:hypothetical protein